MAQFLVESTPDSELPECCRNGFLFETIGDTDTYVIKGATHVSQDKAIVIFTDAFGHKSQNTRLMADVYAQGTGITVYVPDLMAGDAIDFEAFVSAKDPMVEHFMPFLGRNGDSKAIPIVDRFLDALRNTTGVKKVAGIGFSWGGRYVTLAAVGGKLDLLAMAHPSRLEVPQVFENVKVPTLCLCAEGDSYFAYPAAVEATHEIFVRNGVTLEIQVFPGTQHGFATQNFPLPNKAKIDAVAAAIKFFQIHL